MSFISYAQNFEDVMLWRALRHVEKGFYIDVGAAWPDEHSVTKAFYERGWHGINIEPNPEFHCQLEDRRLRDKNLRIALGECDGILNMNIINSTGLSTLDDAIADEHQNSGWSLDRKEVEVRTLAGIWQQYVPNGQEVHFLKVDVEGFEEAVLRGNKWRECRPWIVVVEATLPMSQVESHDNWEEILLVSGYQFAYADGLNRFYVAQEHSDLLLAFKYPPNVFDDFLLSQQQGAEARASQAEALASQAEALASQAEARVTHAEARASQAETRASQAKAHAEQNEKRSKELETELEFTRNELHNVHKSNHHHWQLAETRHQEIQALMNSTSWRITWPLRKAMHFLRWALRLPKGGMRWFLTKLMAFTLRHEWLKKYVLFCLRGSPGLEARLRTFARAHGLINEQESTVQSIEKLVSPSSDEINQLSSLTPRARQIYAQLKAEIEKRQKENG